MYIGADRPKTQKSILKVGNNIQNMIANKNKIDEMNGYDISLDAKVENDGRSETVFGQSGGGGIIVRLYPLLDKRWIVYLITVLRTRLLEIIL